MNDSDYATNNMQSELYKVHSAMAYQIERMGTVECNWVNVSRLAERVQELATRLHHRQKTLATLAKMRAENPSSD